MGFNENDHKVADNFTLEEDPVSEVVLLRREIKLLTDDNNLMRVKLGNLESRYKQEQDLTAAYRKVIKDMAEDL